MTTHVEDTSSSAGAGSSGLPAVPALVVGAVSHTRRVPVRHRFRYRMYQWLVDVDDLPRLPRWLRPFSTFRAADHIGDPDRTLRENVETFCREQGLDARGRRILMLANARTLGHVFDPLTVFWVLDGDRTEAIVAEVHNTYGERHAYFLRPDPQGRTSTDKAFYVSPFFTVAGRYDLQFRLQAEAVASTVILRQSPSDDGSPATAPGEAVFSATFRGEPRPVTATRLARLLVAMPLMTHRVSLLIRIHGVWLWLRRLPVVPRPAHEPQKGTTR
ncbi:MULTISPECIES: DUF1365 domain-containing protein [unclassified Aeromicrobium]|uniref:DUF1365 domain-containing protein n=1 Tax=unclassified Aeromicrobium TaxID=2633570 RepID=UPI00214F7194|nr:MULTISPECIES: DUF1365 domain-containing protein [unclassified Aeromicrobium]MCR4512039.1 DUF1365 domain-containing protein [Aeromicrobium sp. 50.2.37]